MLWSTTTENIAYCSQSTKYDKNHFHTILYSSTITYAPFDVQIFLTHFLDEKPTILTCITIRNVNLENKTYISDEILNIVNSRDN